MLAYDLLRAGALLVVEGVAGIAVEAVAADVGLLVDGARVAVEVRAVRPQELGAVGRPQQTRPRAAYCRKVNQKIVEREKVPQKSS